MIPTETVNESVRRVRYLASTIPGILRQAALAIANRQAEIEDELSRLTGRLAEYVDPVEQDKLQMRAVAAYLRGGAQVGPDPALAKERPKHDTKPEAKQEEEEIEL